MILETEYSATDFAQATAAQNAFFSRGGEKGRSRTPRSGMVGWMVIAAVGAVGPILAYLKQAGFAQASSSSSAHPPTQNLLLCLLLPCIAPLFATALLLAFTKRSPQTPRIPFHHPRTKAGASSGLAPRIAAIAVALLGVVDVLVCGILPAAPDFTPLSSTLILISLAPWLAFILINILLAKLWRSSARGKPSGLRVTLRLGQRLEATDAFLAVSNDLTRTEFSWSYFVSFLESDNQIQLFTQDLTLVLVPKRTFSTAGSLIAFLEIIQRHIPVGQLLSRPIPRPTYAFPVSQVGPVAVLPVVEHQTTGPSSN